MTVDKEEKKPKQIMIFDNGNIAVFDGNGEQMPKLQDGWINFKQIRNIAELIAKNPDIEVCGTCRYLDDYITAYKRVL